MSVLGEVEGVIRAIQGPLEVAQERVDRLELGSSGESVGEFRIFRRQFSC